MISIVAFRIMPKGMGYGSTIKPKKKKKKGKK